MNKTIQALVILAFIAVIVSGVIYLNNESDKPKFLKKVAGVDVYSRIPAEDFMEKKVLGLHLYDGSAETTCNFELSPVSTIDRKGYDVQIERKPLSIMLDWRGAYIRGETDDEILQACHAFLCLRENISCPTNLMDARELFLRNKDMIISIDNRTGAAGIRGYAELLGTLGFMQAKLADTNKDGTLDKNEIVNNSYHIFPYIMEGDTCVLQQFKNAIQTLNITNNTASCEFLSGIYITPSRRNQIQIEGRKILISGDEDHLYTEALIIRDIISPEWIMAYYGLK